MPVGKRPMFVGPIDYRVRRKALGATGAALSLTLVFGSCTAERPDPPPEAVASSKPGPESSPAEDDGEPPDPSCDATKERPQNEFVPATFEEDGDSVLPATWPDGSTAELRYPPDLGLAELGVQPAVSVGIMRKGSRLDHERFLLISREPIREVRSDKPPVETYRGPLGEVNVYETEHPRQFLYPRFMHFKVGAWNVIVGDGNAGNFMGRANRKLWAENLNARETESGFIVFDPHRPLVFASEPNLILNHCFRFVELRFRRCKDLGTSNLARGQTSREVGGVTVHLNRSKRQFYANWCTHSRRISVYLDDRNQGFVNRAVETLKVRRVKASRAERS